MYSVNRESYRKVFFDAWLAFKEGRKPDGAAGLIVTVALDHPEYQEILDHREKYFDRDYLPEFGETNPFLHMSMHVSILEQVSIDQPIGIRALYEEACRSFADVHRAQHVLMDCLAEMVWQAQQQGAPYDGEGYLACIRNRLTV